MRIAPGGRLGALVDRATVWALRAAIAVTYGTCRRSVVTGAEHLARLAGAGDPVILCFWHNRSILGAGFIIRTLLPAGARLTGLASRSRDGELVAGLGRSFGVPTVRGSSSRGRETAVRALLRAIARDGASPVIVPDGPRGPVYEVKSGTVALSRMTGAPIVPVSFAAHPYRALGSWDRLVVPRPFGRVAIAVGEPWVVARDLGAEELAAADGELRERLMALTRQAEAAVGATDPIGPA